MLKILLHKEIFNRRSNYISPWSLLFKPNETVKLCLISTFKQLFLQFLFSVFDFFAWQILFFCTED